MTIDLVSSELGTVVAAFSPPPATPDELKRYALASGDMNPLHLDRDFARQAGFENLVVHGMLGMAHLGRLLTDNFSPARIRSFNGRFAAVILAGDAVTYQARIIERSDETATLELEAICDAGRIAINGRAEVLLREAQID